jgi:hypothetical protein
VLVVPPYPHCIEEDHHDVDLEDCWTALPQLFFSCQLRPTGGRKPKDGRHKTGPDYLMYDLVFFSTFDELSLPTKGPMEDAGVVKLYEPSPTPCLYVAPAANLVGRIPWQGRGKPRLGGLTIEETSDRQDSARKASDKRRKETHDGSKGDGA